MNPDITLLTALLRKGGPRELLNGERDQGGSVNEKGARSAARQDERSWEHLLVAARDAGLCGRLLESVNAQGWNVPASVRVKLEAEVGHVAARNRVMLKHLATVTAAFAEANVDLMALKGAALLLCLYEHAGHRPMCDVDLLIHPDDADRAARVLRQIGYQPGRALLTRDFFPNYYYEAEYLSVGPNPVRLDVHVRPFRPVRYHGLVPEAAMWSDRRGIEVGAATVYVPSDENMLIHLACHAGFHGAERPLWLADVQQFATLRRRTMDWDLVVRRLNEWRLACAARLAFDRAESMFGSFLDERIRDELRAVRVGWRDRLATRQAPRDADSPWARTLVDLLCAPGWKFRLGYLRAVLLPDRAHWGPTCHEQHGLGYAWAAGRRALTSVSRVLRRLWPTRNDMPTQAWACHTGTRACHASRGRAD